MTEGQKIRSGSTVDSVVKSSEMKPVVLSYASCERGDCDPGLIPTAASDSMGSSTMRLLGL